MALVLKAFTLRRGMLFLATASLFSVQCERRHAIGQVGTMTPSASAAPSASPTPPTATDGQIMEAVERLMAEDPVVAGQHLAVQTQRGIVTLAGSVPDLLAKQRAIELTKTLRGVRGVVDNVTVNVEARADRDVERDVAAAIHGDAATRHQPVRVSVQRGIVTLSGTTSSWEERAFCTRLAASVQSVTNVENRIRVPYQLNRSDADIAHDVDERLKYDVWLDGSSLQANVVLGVVRLTGTVVSLAQGDRALDDGWVLGTRDVSNQQVVVDPDFVGLTRMQLPPGPATDGQLAAAIRSAFRYDPRLHGSSPEVAVKGGEARLTGEVISARTRRAAAEDARDTVGVKDVMNDIQVKPEAAMSDAALKRKVEQAISTDRKLGDAKDVRVSASNGSVMLTGALGSPIERLTADRDAEGVPGVRDVENRTSLSLSPAEISSRVLDRLYWDPLITSKGMHVEVSPDGVVSLDGSVDRFGEARSAAKDAKSAGAAAVVTRLRIEPTTASNR